MLGVNIENNAFQGRHPAVTGLCFAFFVIVGCFFVCLLFTFHWTTKIYRSLMYTTKIWWKMIGLETTFGICVAKKEELQKTTIILWKGKEKIEKKKKKSKEMSLISRRTLLFSGVLCPSVVYFLAPYSESRLLRDSSPTLGKKIHKIWSACSRREWCKSFLVDVPRA